MTVPTTIALSSRHEQLKRLRRLVRQAKVRSSERAFVVDGPTLVAEALRAPIPVQAIFVGATTGLRALLDANADVVSSLSDDVVLYEVEDRVLAPILDPRNPIPVAAVVSAPASSLADLPVDRPVLVAVELRDPGNLGTLIRTAEAAGCGGIVVTGTTVDPLNPKVVRASAGSVLRLPVVEIAEVGPCLAAVRAAGRLLVATVVDPKADHYDQVDLRVAAILVGNEPRGLDASVVDQVDLTVTIPMEAGIESLNVAAAGAVMAFESARQRRAGSDRS